MNIKTEESPCGLCANKDYVILFSVRDILYSTEGRYNIIKCAKCGLIRLNPRPSENDILKFYPLYEYPSYALKKKSLINSCIETISVRKKCNLIKGRATKGNILDIGCASGIFLREMDRRGWNVSGIEINKAVVDFIPDKEKLNIKCGKLSDFSFPNEYFDAITLWHVLEHLHQPGKVLEQIRPLLKKDGVLIICCPDLDSIESKIFEKYFAGFDVPRHLYDFSAQTLKVLLEICGFILIKKGTYFGTENTFKLSFSNITKEKLKDTIVRKILLKLIDNLILSFMFYPFFLFMERLNLGSIMTCFAKKKYPSKITRPVRHS